MFIPQDRYIKIDTLNTRYFAEGEGSTVVLVHGLGGSASGWLPSIEAIAARHRLYAMDLPGHGRTDPADYEVLNPAFMANFVNHFMQEFKLERAHIVGHSMGGAVAMQLAIDHPERVDHLVLADSGGLGKEIGILLRFLSLPLIGEWLAGRDFSQGIKEYAQATRKSAHNTTFITDELIEALYKVERNPDQAKPLLKALRLGADWRGQKESIYAPILHRLPTICNPTLLIWGRQDVVIPLAHG
jgi:pimeloyl-ACP methyl ester carboxylesterase